MEITIFITVKFPKICFFFLIIVSAFDQWFEKLYYSVGIPWYLKVFHLSLEF